MAGITGRSGKKNLDDPKNSILTIRFSESEYQEITTYAKENNLSITQLLVESFRTHKENDTTEE